MSAYIQSNIQLWRQKAREGTMSADDLRDAIAAIRAERLSAGAISTASKEKKATAKAKKEPVDAQALLDGLGL